MIYEISSRPLVWLGSTRKDFGSFPETVKSDFGYALFVAQTGGIARKSKPLKGFKGSGVVEVVADFRGDTYRAVYTVRFEEAVYVLHAFQKKSTQGIATRQHDLKLIEQRLKEAGLLSQRAQKEQLQ